jgi:hypothetical protein
MFNYMCDHKRLRFPTEPQAGKFRTSLSLSSSPSRYANKDAYRNRKKTLLEHKRGLQASHNISFMSPRRLHFTSRPFLTFNIHPQTLKNKFSKLYWAFFLYISYLTLMFDQISMSFCVAGTPMSSINMLKPEP